MPKSMYRNGNGGSRRKGTDTPGGPESGQSRSYKGVETRQKLKHPSQDASAQQWHKNRQPSQDGGSS